MADQPSSNPVDVHAEASPVQSDATHQQAANVTQTEAIVEKKGSPISQMIDKDGNYMCVIYDNYCYIAKLLFAFAIGIALNEYLPRAIF